MSGAEAGDFPLGVLPRIEQSVMESTWPPLPELNIIRMKPVASPERRKGDVRSFGPFGLKLGFTVLESGPVRDDGSLFL